MTIKLVQNGLRENMMATVFFYRPCGLRAIQAFLISINKSCRSHSEAEDWSANFKWDKKHSPSHWLHWDGIKWFNNITFENFFWWRLVLHSIQPFHETPTLFYKIKFAMKLQQEDDIKTSCTTWGFQTWLDIDKIWLNIHQLTTATNTPAISWTLEILAFSVELGGIDIAMLD